MRFPLQITVDEINRKIKEAPDASYKIGVLIGDLLPFTVLVILAYLMYSYAKRHKEHEPFD